MLRPLALMLLLLGGCAPYIQRAEMIDAAAEPGTDAAVAFAMKRACSLPMDVQARAIRARGRDYLTGLTLICADWAMVRDMILTAPTTLTPAPPPPAPLIPLPPPAPP